MARRKAYVKTWKTRSNDSEYTYRYLTVKLNNDGFIAVSTEYSSGRGRGKRNSSELTIIYPNKDEAKLQLSKMSLQTSEYYDMEEYIDLLPAREFSWPEFHLFWKGRSDVYYVHEGKKYWFVQVCGNGLILVIPADDFAECLRALFLEELPTTARPNISIYRIIAGEEYNTDAALLVYADHNSRMLCIARESQGFFIATKDGNIKPISDGKAYDALLALIREDEEFDKKTVEEKINSLRA